MDLIKRDSEHTKNKKTKTKQKNLPSDLVTI